MPLVRIDVVEGRRTPGRLCVPAGAVRGVGRVTGGTREDRPAGRSCWGSADGDL